MGSVHGPTRTSVAAPCRTSRWPMTRSWLCTSGAGGHGGAAGSAVTTRGGDAVASSLDHGPAHRHAAHSHSSTTDGGGPWPSRRAIGLSPVRSARSATPTTQPRTLRPCSDTRTRSPTAGGGLASDAS